MWFDTLTAWAVALVTSGIPFAKEKMTRKISAENWGNKELIHRDRMSGMSEREIIKNVERGKYWASIQEAPKYPEPHRESDGRIIIENCDLYEEDVKKYGAYQAQQWMKQGKYNLSPEELEKEKKKIRDRFAKLYGLDNQASS